MKWSRAILALATLLLLTPIAALAIDGHISRSFDAKAGGTLFLEAEYGDIEIRTHTSSKVDVRVLREAKTSSESKAAELFADYRVTFNQSGDRIEIVAETPRYNWNWTNGLSVKFEVAVPSTFNLDLRTSGGDVVVADLRGDIEARTSGGDLNFGRVDGRVNVRTSGGDVDLHDVTGDVIAKTSGGDVSIGRVGGRVEARTSGGDVEVRGSAAELEVSTSGGDVDLFDIEGPVRAATSGGSISARLTRAPTETCNLGTSGGSITLYLAQGIGLDIDASSSGGRVSADVPVTITEMDGESRLSGSVNGGGPRMTLRTSSGSIRIKNLE